MFYMFYFLFDHGNSTVWVCIMILINFNVIGQIQTYPIMCA